MELSRDIETALLACWPVARLATTTPARRPHAVPVVFAPAAECLWCPFDAKPKRAGQLARERNVEAHPQVALLLDEYTEDWQLLWWLRIDGRAEVLRQAADPSAFAAGARALREKYPQYTHTPLSQGEPRLLRIEPQHVRSWCAGAAARAALARRLDLRLP